MLIIYTIYIYWHWSAHKAQNKHNIQSWNELHNETENIPQQMSLHHAAAFIIEVIQNMKIWILNSMCS